jgi:TRAP-type C4-dicarboxylate transport system permease small subunit
MSLKKGAHSTESVVHSLSRVLNIMGRSVQAAMMLLTVRGVILRYFISKPVAGSVVLIETS